MFSRAIVNVYVENVSKKKMPFFLPQCCRKHWTSSEHQAFIGAAGPPPGLLPSPDSGLKAVEAPERFRCLTLKEEIMSKIQKKPVALKSVVTKNPAVKIAKGKEAEKQAKGTKPAKPESTLANMKGAGRNASKQATLISLLQRPTGATVEEMAKTMGWQKHSVLGAISGVLKKRLGLSISSAKEERGRVYRIAGTR